MASINNSSNLRIKFCDYTDSLKLFELRNEKSVRKVSFNKRVISKREHDLWLRHRLEQWHELGPIYIFMLEDTTVGMVRLDKTEESEFEISIIVESNYRHMHLGTKMLQMTVDEVRKNMENKFEITAKVASNNVASRRFFENNGFRLVYSNEKYDQLSLFFH